MFPHQPESKTDMDPASLTDEMVRSIGREYLEKYPTATTFHQNQEAARTLANFDRNMIRLPAQRWSLLLVAYAQLQATSGTIANQIEKLFLRAWGGPLPAKYEERRAGSESQDLRHNPEQYAIQLYDKIRDRLPSLGDNSEFRPFSGPSYRLGNN